MALFARLSKQNPLRMKLKRKKDLKALCISAYHKFECKVIAHIILI